MSSEELVDKIITKIESMYCSYDDDHDEHHIAKYELLEYLESLKIIIV